LHIQISNVDLIGLS